jgi:HlyD family secretion protein
MKDQRRRNALLIGAGLVVVALIGIFGSLRNRSKELELRVQTVRRGTLVATLPETGVVQRPTTQVLPALVGGNVGTINVHPGQALKAGQVVATIVNPSIDAALATAQSAASAAQARANTARETNAALPAQNRSAVTGAEANLQTAKAALQQARQDYAAGQQSGLGYGGSTAEDQRVQADAVVAKANTDLREAQRIYDANRDLYAQRAISRDALDQSRARLDDARVASDQAHRQRQLLTGSLARAQSVLADRVRAASDGLRQAEAALDAAKANASESHAGEVQAAEDEASRAASDLQYAQDQVARLSIRAPFDGIVQTVASEPNDPMRPLQPGDQVQPGQAVVTIAAGGTFVVRTKVDEQDISGIRIGQRARVGGEDFAGKSLTGHVSQISAVAQKSEDPSNTARQVITTVSLDQQLPFLRDGMTVDVDITTANLKGVLTVPTDAVHREGGHAYVFVLRAGKAHKVAVTTGASSDTAIAIVRGLSDGDVVIAEKDDRLADGVAVRARPSPSPSGSP